jgi:ABC-2 type transport system ATP-binding protein
MVTTARVAELSGAVKRYGKITALDGLDLVVRRGELLSVLGPNGAGKTTAISMMLGLLRPDAGSVQVFGGSPRSLEVRRNVGVMMQEAGLAPELRVREHIDLVSSYYPDPRPLDEILKMTGTTALSGRRYGQLSGGQKRQVQFAMAICGGPQLLFLDEPTAGLDVEARGVLWASLQRLRGDGCAIVLTTHYLEEAEALADRVVVMARGLAIASGTVSDLRGFTSRKRIFCSTRLDPVEIRSWPGVVAVSRDRERLQVTAGDAEAVVRRLLDADGTLRDLEIDRAGLAEVFLELTKEKDR